MRKPIHLLGALLLVPLAACHTFAPVQRGDLVPGQSILVTLTPQASADQVQALGSLRRSVQGTVRDVEGSTLGLTLASANGEAASSGLRTYLELPWNGVAGIEQKEFSWLRTGLFAGGAALVTVVILNVADDSGGGDGEPGGINEQRVSIPLFSIR